MIAIITKNWALFTVLFTDWKTFSATCKQEQCAVITHSDSKGLQSFSILIIGVGAQQLPSLLTLIVQALKTETVQYQTHFASRQRPLLTAAHSYVDTEVSGGAGQRPARGQRFGDVL